MAERREEYRVMVGDCRGEGNTCRIHTQMKDNIKTDFQEM
jgi:hypothetical protein